jgi:prepilin-type N-terminal cleavage/methylation domain-containing protein/prepilin-type processing-associated H-X9-DG protein
MLPVRTNGWPQRWRVRGFTLIELLVVVAIIGLLASILLPSLSRARKRAQAVVCASHLKQLARGVLYYAEDFGGVIPPFTQTGKPRTMDPRPENRAWGELIDPYTPSDNVAYINGQAVYSGIHRCPNKRTNQEEGDPTAPIVGSYGLNAYLCSFLSWRINKPKVVFDWVGIDDPHRPGDTVLSSESCRLIVTPALPDPNDATIHGPLVYRHRDLANSNVAWVDGHVTSEPSALLVENKQWWDLDWYEDKPYAGGFPAEDP